jgi:predicted CXXCH cytochrome family protein
MIRKSDYTDDRNPLSRLLIILSCSFILLLAGCKSQFDESKTATDVKPKIAQFVERQLCIECHEDQYKEWIDSHHDLAMDVATDETVIGDFNNSTFAAHGVTSTFYKRDKKFFIRTDGSDGKLHDYEITYVFGVDPLQQYMIEFPDGRIQLPDIGWDDHPKEEGGQRWFHIHPYEKITPRHIFHWTRRFLNWNYMCGECHTTNFQKNYDLESNTFNTTWTMIDVGCQACHGPGSNHVEWARSMEKSDSSKEYTFEDTGLEVNLKADDSHVQIGACARCHSRRNGLRKDYKYGRPFMDYYVPQVMTDPLYYPDGQILDEVYVYGSFLQSKKYQQGVRCTDCHNPHTARLHVYGNELCTRCHDAEPVQQSETVARKEYDSPGHHFHEEDSPGAQCVECHMPETKYMIVDPRRDHKFQIPRPDLSVKLDIPNPCNRCHEEQSAQWAADRVNEWYSESREMREKETHFAEYFAAGQDNRPAAEKGLIAVAGDESQAPIIRATAINILSRFSTGNSLDITATSLENDDPLVRYEAVRGISALIQKRMETEYQKNKYSLLVPLLKDPIRAVRTEAARALTEVPAELFQGSDRQDFEKALDEYKQRQESIADRPEAHLNLGIMYENLGQNALVEASYKTAIRLVDDFTPAMFNLANFYNRTGRNKEAEQQFHEIIKLEPDNGEAYYSLGLLLAEEKRLDEAVDAMAKAVELLPDSPRIRYNYSLILRHLGRNGDSLSEMLKAHELDQSDPGIVQALAIFYIQDKQWEKALSYAQKLVQLAPAAPGPEQMVKQIEQAMSAEQEKIE